LAFNDLKIAVKQETFCNEKQLEESIIKNIPSLIGKTDNYFRHTVKYYPMAILKTPFRGKPLTPVLIEEPESDQSPVQTSPSNFLTN